MKESLKEQLRKLKHKKFFFIVLIFILILIILTAYLLINREIFKHSSEPATSKNGVPSEISPSVLPSEPGKSSLQPSEAPGIEHLEFYDSFDWYNSSSEYFKGFILSEAWIDGEPYYQLLNEVKDVKILVDKTQENAVIYHDGKSVDYDMEFMISETTTHAELELWDVTGDGTEDLIIYHYYGGTGIPICLCDVINLSTMTQCRIDSFYDELYSKFTIVPVDIDESNNLICQVTDVNGNVSYGYVEVDNNCSLDDFSDIYPREMPCDMSADHIKNCISANIDICFYDGLYIFGNISSDLIYNEDTNSFNLSKEFHMHMDEIDYDPNAPENASVNQLLQKIISADKSYSDYAVDIVKDDFNEDGKIEYFFVFTEQGADRNDDFDFCADIWFGSNNQVNRVLEWGYINPDFYGEIIIAEKKYFRYDQAYPANSYTVLLSVENNQCIESFSAYGFACFSPGESDFSVLFDCYDLLYDKELEANIGHTWKNYYFYADADGFHEYGAHEITQDEFLQFTGAEAALEDIDKKYASKGSSVNCTFMRRSNGMLHINISYEEEDGIYYYYETYRIDENNTLVYYESGEGNYISALDEEIAVYYFH